MVSNDPFGYREVFTHNRYLSIYSAVFVRERHKVLTAGTIRKTERVWIKSYLIWQNKSVRGDSKVYYDKTNKVIIAQWYDNKLVTLVSIVGVKGKLPIQRRKGSDLIYLTTKACVKSYQLGMGDVDRGDQIRETGASLCQNSHFKKRYNKYVFAVCDFMVLNSFIAWNMSTCERKSKKNVLQNSGTRAKNGYLKHFQHKFL